MLAVEAISGTQLRDRPFRWARVDGIFASSHVADRLAREIPRDGFEWASRMEGDKTYRMANRTIVDDDALVEGALGGLNAGWRSIIEQIRSREYRSALGALTGRPLENARLEARFCKYDADCWMAPHTDRPDKLVTQIVYLNPQWHAGWGGGLEILGSDRREDVVEVVVPRLGTSVVLVRSDASWHAVAPLHPRVEVERVSLLVHFTGG